MPSVSKTAEPRRLQVSLSSAHGCRASDHLKEGKGARNLTGATWSIWFDQQKNCHERWEWWAGVAFVARYNQSIERLWYNLLTEDDTRSVVLNERLLAFIPDTPHFFCVFTLQL